MSDIDVLLQETRSFPSPGAFRATARVHDSRLHDDAAMDPVNFWAREAGELPDEQEIFGPLLPVITYEGLEQALGFVLARDKPLAFYLFDRESARVDAVLGRICAGSVCINDVLVQFGQDDLPIGGVGASGMGHYHGRDGFLTFSKAMPVMHQARLNGMHLFDPPYGRIITRLVDFLTRP